MERRLGLMLGAMVLLAGCGFDSGVEGARLEDVWVFRHFSREGEDGELESEARIVDGCLMVGDFVPIWPTLAEAQEALFSVDGSGAVFIIGSGQYPVPEVVLEHCPSAAAVWYVSPK